MRLSGTASILHSSYIQCLSKAVLESSMGSVGVCHDTVTGEKMMGEDTHGPQMTFLFRFSVIRVVSS